MKLSRVAELLDARVLCGEDKLEKEIECACGSDMMSDVLAFTKHKSILLTGLVNNHVLRTAEMLDIECVVFVRGKNLGDNLLNMACDMDIVAMSCELPMFTACGVLYQNGIKGGMREVGNE